jgi:hypothetical protein
MNEAGGGRGQRVLGLGFHGLYCTPNGGGVEVRSKTEPRQPVEVIARDLKACNDESGMGYVGRLQFRRCMDPRGYAVTSRD